MLCVLYTEHYGKLCLHFSDSYVSLCKDRLIAYRINGWDLKKPNNSVKLND